MRSTKVLRLKKKKVYTAVGSSELKVHLHLSNFPMPALSLITSQKWRTESSARKTWPGVQASKRDVDVDLPHAEPHGAAAERYAAFLQRNLRALRSAKLLREYEALADDDALLLSQQHGSLRRRRWMCLSADEWMPRASTKGSATAMDLRGSSGLAVGDGQHCATRISGAEQSTQWRGGQGRCSSHGARRSGGGRGAARWSICWHWQRRLQHWRAGRTAGSFPS